MLGICWNAHDEQIPKLSLGVQFDQDFMEKTWKTFCCKLFRADCIITYNRSVKHKVAKSENGNFVNSGEDDGKDGGKVK